MKIIIVILMMMFLAFIVILNLNVGCFQDREFLLKQMFHEDFPANYVLINESESTLLDFLYGNGSCAFDVMLNEKDHQILQERIVDTKFWKKSHPSWGANSCKNLLKTSCDVNKMENTQILEKTGLICFADFYPGSFTVELSCHFL